MKISEMSIEELREYALQLEEDKTLLTDENASLKAEKAELDTFNKNLQKRNNELFLKVEQARTAPDDNGAGKEEKPVESCEDFARKLILGE